MALAQFGGLQRLLAVDMGARYSGLAVRVSPLLGVQRYGLLERQRAWRPPRGPVSDEHWSWELRPEGHTGARPARFPTQAAALWSIVHGLDVGGVVVGMPYLAGGERSRECDIVEAAVAKLRRSWPREVPVLLWDESWSTRLAIGPGPPSAKQRARAHAAVACQLLAEVVVATASRHTDGSVGLEGVRML
jgi:RNase H-fold protein (predicted Holliday junction resolvase)